MCNEILTTSKAILIGNLNAAKSASDEYLTKRINETYGYSGISANPKSRNQSSELASDEIVEIDDSEEFKSHAKKLKKDLNPES